MKNIIVILTFLISFGAIAQKKLKIKGNKEVTEVINTLDGFSKIEITDGLEVSLMQTYTEGYRLKTDSNLVDHIKFEVLDSVLKISTKSKIVSSKKLEIYITFLNIEAITLSNDSKLIGQNKFDLAVLNLKAIENSKFELDISTDNFELEMNTNTKGKLKLKSTLSKINLEDNAYLKASFSGKNLELKLNKRADANLEGDIENLDLSTTGSSDIKAKNLKVSNAKLNTSNTVDVYLYTSNQLSIYASGKSNIYVYGNPEIKIEGLNDKSQIIKK